MPKQLSPALEIRHEIQIRIRLEREFQANEERAVQRPLEDLALPNRMRNLLLRNDLALREHLHRVDPLRVLLPHLEDTPERPSADELQELEVPRG